MPDIILAISSILLGGFVSWAITHTYYHKDQDGSKSYREVAVHGTIHKNIQECWQAIIEPENRKYFTITICDGYGDAEDEIGAGTIIKCRGFATTQGFHEVVCVWQPPSKFAWGYDLDNWHHSIELKSSGENTIIHLKRRLWTKPLKWHEVITHRIFARNDGQSNRELTKHTLNNIKHICEHKPT